MAALDARQRARLSALATKLGCLAQIGRDGADEGLVARLAELLDRHELVKLRFVAQKGEREALARILAEKTGCELVRIIGNVAIFWKQSSDPERRRINPNASGDERR